MLFPVLQRGGPCVAAKDFFKVGDALVAHGLGNQSYTQITFNQESFRLLDPADINIFIYRVAGRLFENPAQIAFAYEKVPCNGVKRRGLCKVGRNIGSHLGNFLMCH